MNCFVAQFGSHGLAPSALRLNTNAASGSSAPSDRARASAPARCAISTSSVSASSSTRRAAETLAAILAASRREIDGEGNGER